MKRARVRQAARTVLLREGIDRARAERLADLIAAEPIPAEPRGRPGLERLERALERAADKSH
ncbi:MAG TPA: hypothetical protein VGG77_13770 [Roseiarcus sp.]|jgi:hypothetical protein